MLAHQCPLRAKGAGWKRIAAEMGVGVGTIYRVALKRSKTREKGFLYGWLRVASLTCLCLRPKMCAEHPISAHLSGIPPITASWKSSAAGWVWFTKPKTHNSAGGQKRRKAWNGKIDSARGRS